MKYKRTDFKMLRIMDTEELSKMLLSICDELNNRNVAESYEIRITKIKDKRGR